MSHGSIIFCAACGLAACVFGCADLTDDSLSLRADVKRPAKSAILFFVDGLDRRHFEKELNDGQLPNIQKRFADDGVCVDHAIVSMPAITYPNSVSLLTGLLPGHHGILGNQWFDRFGLKVQDYLRASTYRSVNEDFDAPTLFELLRDRFTLNIQCHTRRGVSVTIDHWADSGIDWFFGKYIGIDRRVGGTIQQVVSQANQLGTWPTVLLVYFPGVDMVGHHLGVDSSLYQQALRNVDTQIGRIIDVINRLNLGDSTYFILVTDHGHVQTKDGQTLDLEDWLGQHCGLRIHQGRIDLAHRPDCIAYLNRHDAVVVNGAYRRAAIHLKGPLGWSSPARIEDIQRVVMGQRSNGTTSSTINSKRKGPRLMDLPAVGLVCYRCGKDCVRIVSRNGTCVVERRINEGRRYYRLTDFNRNMDGPDAAEEPPAAQKQSGDHPKADPLGYRGQPELAAFIDQGWHGSRQWLAATAASRYPDFAPQVVEMFDSPRAGDIVVFASENGSFSNREPSGHGSCLEQDMRVPMYFSGPDLPKGGHIDHARLVDVMPTVLDLLGEAARLKGIGPIDGVSLLGELKSARRMDGVP